MEKSLELLSKKYNIPYHVAEYIFSYEFKFVAEHIKTGQVEPIRLQNLGAFVHLPARKKRIDELRTNNKWVAKPRLEKTRSGEASQGES